MWTVVFMSQNKETASDMEKALTGEGILVRLRTASKIQDEQHNIFEVLVPESEVEEAHQIILEKGHS